PLSFFTFGTGQSSSAIASTHWEVLQRLREWGFLVYDQIQRVEGIDGCREYYRRLVEQRDELPFEIDGVVDKVDDLAARDELGVTARAPRWAAADELPAMEATTRVDRIWASVGCSGVLTPVAELEPVAVGGVTVSRATLHTLDELRRKDVRPGYTVLVC